MRNPRRLILGGLVLAFLGLGLGTLPGGGEALAARGTISARARVLEAPAPQELERAKVEFRELIQQSLLHQGRLLEQARPGLSEGVPSRDLDGGRMRLRLEGSPDSGYLTVEYLAN